jgi:uncharacterized protein (DUF736 family)
LQVQAAGGGHLRSRIAGEWSPDENQMETSNDCNRLCEQARRWPLLRFDQDDLNPRRCRDHPNLSKTADAQPDYGILTQGIEIGAGWTKKGETSSKEFVSLAIAAPEFGSRKLYANLGRAADQDDDTLYALIWNPTD